MVMMGSWSFPEWGDEFMIEHKSFVFTFADVEVRGREFCIVKAGEVLPVEPKAFRVLVSLLRNPHRLVTEDELLDAVWSDCAVSENSLTRTIALLRRLLGEDTREPRYIATVPTVGYRSSAMSRLRKMVSKSLRRLSRIRRTAVTNWNRQGEPMETG
jgi:DNA-binding winged helix-turn-helix (wHTH) protein